MKFFFTIFLLIFSISFFSQQKVEDDFEGNGTINSWFGDNCGMDNQFENPYKTGINTSNTVLKYTDTGGQYANVRFDVPVNFDLSTHSVFTLKIYVPSSSITGNQNNQISLKLQDGKINSPWTTQTEIIKNIVLNQWQIITFDFKNDDYINQDANSVSPVNRTDFNRVLLQINDEDNNSYVTAFVDDFSYNGVLNTNNNNTGENPVFDNLVWSDEFYNSGAIDTNKWHHQIIPIINGQDWANGEIQHYTNRTDNSYMSNGSLKILAKKETYTYNNVTKNYTSARLNSKFAFTYGKVEIRAKMPFGAGTFPALWMLGQNITETGGYWAQTHGNTSWPQCGEIDIIEHWGTNQNFVQSALHNGASSRNTINKGGRVIENASSEFHVYTLDWNANRMVFSVDGVVHYTYNPENKNADNWPYDKPQYLLLNVAILPNISSSFTQSAMEIDYVRVYQESNSLSVDNNVLESFLVNAYPNPVNDKLTINYQNNLAINNAVLYDVTGKSVFVFKQKTQTKTYDVSFLKKGIYFLKIQTNLKTTTLKIVKK